MVENVNQMNLSPGPIVLFGSGETSTSGQRVFRKILQTIDTIPKIGLLETPAGFELNSAMVIGRVEKFLKHNLQNFKPDIEIIRARKQGTEFSPNDPDIVDPLLDKDLIFLGPGSPTYAIRQLRGSLTWQYTIARHRLGAALILASAATIAMGAYSLPVYEIYKVGEDVHWKKGLDFFSMYGMPLVLIPHWNNNDGGKDLDTSRCFMGRERFAKLMHILPSGLTLIGIDEHTAMVIEPEHRNCEVMGIGGVTMIHSNHRPFRHPSMDNVLDQDLDEVAENRNAHVHRYQAGETFPLDDWFPFNIPPSGRDIPNDIWEKALDVRRGDGSVKDEIPFEIRELVALRSEARKNADWSEADEIREKLVSLGWWVEDTAEGSNVVKLP